MRLLIITADAGPVLLLERPSISPVIVPRLLVMLKSKVNALACSHPRIMGKAEIAAKLADRK